mmetsp:Transcript_43494/g.143953  ORF Transcript_43494/g.143953 Transcript_43494/m.143953 type:complete len:492 (-) Transcript_43494:292-1767(-)
MTKSRPCRRTRLLLSHRTGDPAPPASPQPPSRPARKSMQYRSSGLMMGTRESECGSGKRPNRKSSQTKAGRQHAGAAAHSQLPGCVITHGPSGKCASPTYSSGCMPCDARSGGSASVRSCTEASNRQAARARAQAASSLCAASCAGSRQTCSSSSLSGGKKWKRQSWRPAAGASSWPSMGWPQLLKSTAWKVAAAASSVPPAAPSELPQLFAASAPHVSPPPRAAPRPSDTSTATELTVLSRQVSTACGASGRGTARSPSSPGASLPLASAPALSSRKGGEERKWSGSPLTGCVKPSSAAWRCSRWRAGPASWASAWAVPPPLPPPPSFPRPWPPLPGGEYRPSPAIGQPSARQCMRSWCRRPVSGRSTSRLACGVLCSTAHSVTAGLPDAPKSTRCRGLRSGSLDSGRRTVPSLAGGAPTTSATYDLRTVRDANCIESERMASLPRASTRRPDVSQSSRCGIRTSASAPRSASTRARTESLMRSVFSVGR